MSGFNALHIDPTQRNLKTHLVRPFKNIWSTKTFNTFA